MVKKLLLTVLPVFLFLMISCSTENTGDPAEVNINDSDKDIKTETETETDTASDLDSDTENITETDMHTDTVSDVDSGIDTSLDTDTEPVFHLFLLFGQSNMYGFADNAEPQDRVEDPRVKVLGYDDCGATGRIYNEWDIAAPPLHACWVNGIGIGDYFGKTLINAYPEKDTIGLIPCAFPGAGMDLFRKDVEASFRSDFFIPPDNHWTGAYEWMVERVKLAQKTGVVDGIIFHQGETDGGSEEWENKVKEVVTDLRTDLGLGDVPFVVGELLYGESGYNGRNDFVNLKFHF